MAEALDITVLGPSSADLSRAREAAPLAAPEVEEIDANGNRLALDWRIRSLSELEWALSRLADTEAEAQETDALAEEWRKRLAQRLAEIKRPLDRKAEFWRMHIQAFAEAHRGELLRDKKKKSRTFIAGTVGWRSKPERLVVTDPAALEEWLLKTDAEAGLYRVKVEPEKKALSDLFKRTGEIPPGCDIEPASESIHIDPVSPTAPLTVKE